MSRVLFHIGAFLLIVVTAHAQTSIAVKQQGDIFFGNGQYTRAIEYYKAALVLEENLIVAEYQLAECYRLAMNFVSAEIHYGNVIESGMSKNSLFPLARYYYGLMKKMNGKYLHAKNEIQLAVEEMKEAGLSEDPDNRKYYLQARVDVAGCQLALQEAERKKIDRNFHLIASPVNTEYNDFAAVYEGNDSLIVISSGRKESKGIYIDYKYGEYYSDFFRFQYNGNTWEKFVQGDQFESVVNTKWGEGSGTFNKDKTVYYFTSCQLENESCFIYKSEKINGEWSRSEPLNQLINKTGFDSKHPNLSSSGDTLFFSSNIDGGQGGFDIWYAVLRDEGEFGKPINMGNHLNTAFDEISPFFYSPDGALFFSSSGHKGFGGYDIFMAKGESLDRIEIFNVGLPHNSNADDCFMSLGHKYGYVSSNRKEGMGRFDIYMFDNEKNSKEIISEIEVVETIAGRQSLFSYDYEFDTKDIQRINQVTSIFLANKISESDLTLPQEDQHFYDNLSMDDKDRIRRVVNARYRKITQSELRALRVEDYFFYGKLGTNNRELVNQIVYSRLEQKGIGQNLKLAHGLKQKYENLSMDDRERIDQMIANRLGQSVREVFEPVIYKGLSEDQRHSIDIITKTYFEYKDKLNHLPLGPKPLYFLSTNNENQQIWKAIRERIILLSEDETFQLSEADRMFYQHLNPDEHKALEDIATAFITEDIRDVSFDQMSHQIKIFKRLNNKSQGRADCVLAKMINNYSRADSYFVETHFDSREIDFMKREYEKDQSIDKILEALAKNEDTNLKRAEERKRLTRFMAAHSPDYLLNTGEELSPEGHEFPRPENNQNLIHMVLGDLSEFETLNYQFINIKGRLVSENTDEPLLGIPVGIQIRGGEIEYETYSDDKGYFEFKDVPSRKYQVLAMNRTENTQNVILKQLEAIGISHKKFSNDLITAIYFDTGESSLRPEAIVSLSEIFMVIGGHSDIKIELHGHTDNIGDQKVNQMLSKERAEKVFQHFHSLGVSPQKIIIKFHGKSRPIANNTTVYGRQFNRRVDIKIQSHSAIDYHPPRVFLVKPHSTLYSISRHFGMEIEEIMDLNGLTTEQLNAYQPLRLHQKEDILSFQDSVVELTYPPTHTVSQ